MVSLLTPLVSGEVAASLDASSDELVALADAETALGEDRLSGELATASASLGFYGEVVAEGSSLQATIDIIGATSGNPPRGLRRVRMPNTAGGRVRRRQLPVRLRGARTRHRVSDRLRLPGHRQGSSGPSPTQRPARGARLGGTGRVRSSCNPVDVTPAAARTCIGGWPTGVANTRAQHHGGPWPATSRHDTTGVGAAAVDRFARPVTFQGASDEVLPPALQWDNPWSVPRRVDGRLVAEGDDRAGRAQTQTSRS